MGGVLYSGGMFWISKYTHNKIVKEYQDALDVQKENINRKEKFEEICEKLTDIVGKIDVRAYENIVSSGQGFATTVDLDVMAKLDDSVAQYVDDYFGGKVIKQEATKLIVIDEKGKATYHHTKKRPNKGKVYKLHIL